MINAPSFETPLARWWSRSGMVRWWRQTTGRGDGTDVRQLMTPRPHREADTVQDWPPEATRVLAKQDRLTHTALVAALPECHVWPHVPLPRLVRVPSRRSYAEWMARIGHLTADFAICDHNSQLLAVVLMPLGTGSGRAERRRERLCRVLQAAGINVVTWSSERFTSVTELRFALIPSAPAINSAAPVRTPAR